MNKLILRARYVLEGADLACVGDGEVLVDTGKITAVGACGTLDGRCAEVIDFGDATILPGMIDAHMHTFGMDSTALGPLFTARETGRALRAAGELSELLRAGFTAARCLGSSIGPDLSRAIANGEIPGPRLVAAGEFLSSVGGTWGGDPKDKLPRGRACAVASGPDEMRQRVRERVEEGANFIKLGLSKGAPDDANKAWGDDPYGQVMTMSDDEVAAAVDEAHRNGMKVSVHAIGEESVAQALRHGIDIIEHGYAISEQTRALIVSSQTPVVTTLSQIHFHMAAFDAFNYPERERRSYLLHWQAMNEGLTEGLRAGVKFVLGTDLIGKPTHPLAAAAKEFELVVAAGMPVMQALRAGTVLGAEILGVGTKTGALVTGLDADIVVVQGDVRADVTALQSPVCVLKGGDIVFRAAS